MGEFLAVIAGICFSMSTMLVQRGMRKATASAGVTVNLLMNNLLFGIMVLVMAGLQDLPPLNMQGVLFAAAGGVSGNLIGRTLSYLGVRRIGSARTTLLMLTQTLFSLVLGMMLLGEVLTWLSLLGVALVMVGVYWLAHERVQREAEVAATTENPAAARHKRVVQGMILAILAGLAYSAADLFRKAGLHALPSAILTSALGGVAAISAQLIVVTVQGGWRELIHLERTARKNFCLAGLVNGLAVVTLNTSLSYTPVAIVSALYSSRIWFIIAMGPVLLGAEEKITWVLVGSTALILAGVFTIIFT